MKYWKIVYPSNCGYSAWNQQAWINHEYQWAKSHWFIDPDFFAKKLASSFPGDIICPEKKSWFLGEVRSDWSVETRITHKISVSRSDAIIWEVDFDPADVLSTNKDLGFSQVQKYRLVKRAAKEDFADNNIFISGQHEVNPDQSIYYQAFNDAKVTAKGLAHVEAHDDSIVYLHDTARATLYNRSKVVVDDSVQNHRWIAFDQSVVQLTLKTWHDRKFDIYQIIRRRKYGS